jgi:subtilisin family serine protease
VTTQAVNIATQLGIVCLTAAGNGGVDQDLPSLIPPGDALDVITVGAVTYAGTLAGFSSNGPSADGRVKPEVLALGQEAVSVATHDDLSYDTALAGTSLSTPLAAGAVACLMQAHPDWTIAQIRAVRRIRSSGEGLASSMHTPPRRTVTEMISPT